MYEENEELKKENNELREIVFMRKKEKKAKHIPIFFIYIMKDITSVIPVLQKDVRVTAFSVKN